MKEVFSVPVDRHAPGELVFEWDPHGKYLAVCGQNKRVSVFTRNGDLHDEFALNGSGQCLQIAWNKNGQDLAVLQEHNSNVSLWNAAHRKSQFLDTNLKEPTFILWNKSPVESVLAIGTIKGNLLLYDQKTHRKIPIMGKHSKRIVCGAWNSDNKLALASVDKMLTISNLAGDTLEQTPLKHEPIDLQFSAQKFDDRSQTDKEHTISVNLAGKTVFLYNLNDPTNPVELQFQSKYGDIGHYRWFGDGYMLAGFSEGYVVAISTHMKEIGEELQCLKVHDEAVSDLVVCAVLNKFASCSADGLRVVDMSDWKQAKTDAFDASIERHNDGVPHKLRWTADGQILTVATTRGALFSFLMSIPVLVSSHKSQMAYLSSLRELTVLDSQQTRSSQIVVPIDVEPSFLALGPFDVAAGFNNQVWFYRLSPETSSASLVSTREYLSTVDRMCLNGNFAASLVDGRVQLHLISPADTPPDQVASNEDVRVFPEQIDDNSEVTCVALTDEFLVFGTSKGSVHQFFLESWAFVNEFRHECAISQIYPNTLGTRLVFVDERNQGWLYSPVDDQRIQIPQFSPSISKVLWDAAHSGVFYGIDFKAGRNIITYVYVATTTKGPQINRVATTKIPHGINVVSTMDGRLYGHRQGMSGSDSIQTITLASHDAVHFSGRRNGDKVRQTVLQLLNLGRIDDAWRMAQSHNTSKDLWLTVARKALDQLDVPLAVRINRELGDAAAVMALEEVAHVEDKHLLAGHVCMLAGDFAQAQDMFLNSSRPITALEMRRDLLEWDVALKLAQQLDPSQTSPICREYAQQLEHKAQYNEALQMYQRGLDGIRDQSQEQNGDLGLVDSEFGDDQHEELNLSAEQEQQRLQCLSGIARMTIRLGDIQRGRDLALRTRDHNAIRECAALLETMKQFQEAADLFVQANQYEKAAALYIHLKDWRKVEPLMAHITTPKLHATFAKAKEADGKYQEAAQAYEFAADLDSVVRLLLTKLNNPQRAFAIVRQQGTAHGAQLVADYCVKINDFKAAMEFLLLAARVDQAFVLAQQHNCVEVFSAALGDKGTNEQYRQIGEYYESRNEMILAGEFFSKSGQTTKAMRLFLQFGEPAIPAAIKLIKASIGATDHSSLVRSLHDYLTGETDGNVKDPNFMFQLYMAIGDYVQAAKIAILIANQEQRLGTYKAAHDILFKTHQELCKEHIPIPEELRRNLLLLHSYVIVKTLIAQKDHVQAARMLIRVSKNISKFPAHIVPILTSTIIECTRAGLHQSAFEWASMLMRPEYRTQIAEKYKKRIQKIVKSRGQSDQPEPEELNAPCPYCQTEFPEQQLDCPNCRNHVPYCVLTGKRMRSADWSWCSSCRFPMTLSSASAHEQCPMCGEGFTAQLDSDPFKTLKAMQKEQDEAEERRNKTKQQQNGHAVEEAVVDDE